MTTLARREYDLFLPHLDGEGQSTASRLDRLKAELRGRFGGVTHFTQGNEGEWRHGRCVYREEVTILRIVAEPSPAVDDFFAALRTRLRGELGQDDVLIVVRSVEVLSD